MLNMKNSISSGLGLSLVLPLVAFAQSSFEGLQFANLPRPDGLAANRRAILTGDHIVLLQADGSLSSVSAVPSRPSLEWKRQAGPSGISNTIVAAGSGLVFVGDAQNRLARAPLGQVPWSWSSFGKTDHFGRNVSAAVMGSNLVVAADVEADASFTPAAGTGVFRGSRLPDGGLVDTFTSVRDLGKAVGGIISGRAGLVRLSLDDGGTFILINQTFYGVWPDLTDAQAHRGSLLLSGADGSVMQASIPPDRSNPSNWKWSKTKVSSAGLRSMSVMGDELLVVGDNEAAYRLSSGEWSSLDLPFKSQAPRSWIHVAAPTNGIMAGMLALVSNDSVLVASPTHPKPRLASPEPSLDTCEGSGTQGLSFTAEPAPGDPWARFSEIDWYQGDTLLASSSPTLPLRETLPGTYSYTAVARDTRTGLRGEGLTVTHVVHALPAVPLTSIPNGVLEQCESDGAMPLSVMPAEGVQHEWYEAPAGGSPLAQGDHFVPPALQTGVYYVEAVQRHGTATCRSPSRLRIDHLVHRNPQPPEVVQASWTLVECDPAPRLSVVPRPGEEYVWYQSIGERWEAVSTNNAFTPARMVSAQFEVEAIATKGGCRSLQRTPLRLEVKPVLSLASIPTMTVPPQSTNKTTRVVASPSGSLTSTHRITWISSGDGTVTKINELEATYSPGPGDLAAQKTEITLRLEDSISSCATRETSFTIRYLPVPTLKIQVRADTKLSIEWQPTPGWILQRSASLPLDRPVTVAAGEDGAWEIPGDEAPAYFRLIVQP